MIQAGLWLFMVFLSAKIPKLAAKTPRESLETWIPEIPESSNPYCMGSNYDILQSSEVDVE